MTVYKPIFKEAKISARSAIKLAEGKQIKTDKKIYNGKKDVPAILLKPISVDKSNINSTVIADGFHSYEEVYSP